MPDQPDHPAAAMPAGGTRELCTDEDCAYEAAANGGDAFVIIREGCLPTTDTAANPAHRYFSTVTGRDVSEMIDMADCDSMEGVVAILAIGRDGTLRPVKAGPMARLDPEDRGRYFATAPLLTDDGRLVGTVHYTDH
jgi:hypothetical protein